jgi:hypothetical protein
MSIGIAGRHRAGRVEVVVASIPITQEGACGSTQNRLDTTSGIEILGDIDWAAELLGSRRHALHLQHTLQPLTRPKNRCRENS